MSFFGKDCPKGMVQVECVALDPTERSSAYGWKPTTRATLDIYVDGQRYHIVVGNFHDGYEERRGLHIVGPPLACQQTALNAVSIWSAESKAVQAASTEELATRAEKESV